MAIQINELVIRAEIASGKKTQENQSKTDNKPQEQHISDLMPANRVRERRER